MSATVTVTPTKVRLRILRQKDQASESYWDEFVIPYKEKMNVISALMEIQKDPRTADGKRVQPPSWDAACLEEVCGSCTMNINGMIRQACTALIEEVGEAGADMWDVSLEPMKKFPVVRDLVVDRSRMFENLMKVKAWVPIDGSYDLGMAPPQDDHVRQLRYALSRCMTCGCCVEACPQVNEKSTFVGPAAVGQALLFNLQPVGKTLENDRLEFLSGEEGITGCGNAQNCVKVCPKGVPLTRAIAQINRDTTVYKLKRWVGIA
ncbi:succinate dehydrogenase iron-sulfur subunit [Fimbriimonas ginsengisoli]|uniref:succinate dehydrogenase n=1 Tax=Fimbriimonas ginsengisoli Gsoil 348 TaxID=661478 RepID=A0A068NVW3_FIMGI|nr:succinate dehydrogenase iron-sulfur subunit [Fimbriimonas ginsengisoli]AIE87502.1 succinate dehydrogenase iron-sulfur subunit [Fimbriimonas ginsengisoli Gsoil 348]